MIEQLDSGFIEGAHHGISPGSGGIDYAVYPFPISNGFLRDRVEAAGLLRQLFAAPPLQRPPGPDLLTSQRKHVGLASV